MYRETAKLLLYSNLGEDAILARMADIFRDWEAGSADKSSLISRIYAQVKRLLDLATVYGFNRNLWQNYLTFLLMTNENSFSLTCERVGATSMREQGNWRKSTLSTRAIMVGISSINSGIFWPGAGS